MSMTNSRALVSGFVGAFALIATVHAADAPDSWSRQGYERQKLHPTELMSGWYLRGDLGYRYNTVASVTAPNPLTGLYFGDSFGATFGFGHKYRWFRTDLTFDYGSSATYRGHTAAAVAQPQYTGKIDAFSILANAYFDLGKWMGLTPYVGGGVGATSLRSAMAGSSAVEWNPSFAAMTGVSYQFTPTWVLDVGYRYLYLGTVGSGGIASTTWRHVETHEFRVGGRFMFD